MHEKDIELTRLLLARQHEIESMASNLESSLAEARSDLDVMVEETRQRDVFESVLAKAADLLARPDLQVAPPDLSDKELSVENLTNELEGLAGEIGRVRDLVEELQSKAPDLVSAARKVLHIPEAEEPKPEVEFVEPAPEPTHFIVEPEVAVKAVAESDYTELEAQLNEQPISRIVVEPVKSIDSVEMVEDIVAVPEAPTSVYPGLPKLQLDKDQTKTLLASFDLRAVRQNQIFSHGPGTVYIVDAQSIFENVEGYGFHSEVNNQNEINNRLALEFTALSTEVSGSFHMVFNGDFHPDYDYSERLAADFVEGGEPVPKEDLYGRILHLVEKYTGMLKTVCAVTADQELAELLISKGAHFIPVSELFK